MLRPDPARGAGISVRVKLALSYAGFLVVAGIALFAVGFLMLRFVPEGNLQVIGGGTAPNRSNLVEVFVRYAWWALALLVVFGLVGGWLLAGIVLRPLARMTETARLVRDGAFERRIALAGHRDELTELADAFDAMLDRVEHTIEEERRFAANASHELRTPHAIIRTIVEVAQADPAGRDVDTLLARIAMTNDRAITSTESLLELARVGRGQAPTREIVDVADVVREELDQTDATGLTVHAMLDPAEAHANRPLVERLVTNLVRNAIVHNVPDGRVWVATATTPDGAAIVSVENTGRVLDEATVRTLTEPFVRGAGRTRGGTDPGGAGLGLAIADAVVRAHAGSLAISPRTGGGLQVRVTFPPSPSARVAR